MAENLIGLILTISFSLCAFFIRLSFTFRKAEGYDDDKLYKETLLSEFMESDDPLKCLAKTNKVCWYFGTHDLGHN